MSSDMNETSSVTTAIHFLSGIALWGVLMVVCFVL
jgi:hypothetical protein